MESPLVYILSMLFSVFVFVAIIAFEKWHKYSQEQQLRDLIAWSVSADNHSRCNLSLSEYIGNAQIKLSLPQECRISGSVEMDYMKEILTEYQKDLSQSYFKGRLRLIKSKYVVRGETYFMFALYAFLSDHQCDYQFLGHDMHQETVSYKRYGDWGGPLFDATYSLTDFAVVYHKMHYITYMYCRGNDILRDFVPEWNEKNLKEILDTKQIQISRL